MARVLVIGTGNPLRGDDGFGLRLAAALAERLPAGQAEVIATVQLTPELAEAMSGAERALFLDCRDGAPPGRLEVTPVRLRNECAPALSHHLEASALLHAAAALYGRAPEAALLTVTGADFAFGTGLSPAVQAAFPGAVEHAAALIGDWLRR